MTVTCQLEGQQFIALNGGPQFKFTEAISLLVNCDAQKEVDEYQDKGVALSITGPAVPSARALLTRSCGLPRVGSR
ncbi:MAG: VOC family protein [Gemmatimonadetes bacterium]|nr:VOC family protein [Gemmatimonadota bacterium]